MAKYPKNMKFVLEMSLIDALKKIIYSNWLHLPIAYKHYRPEACKKYMESGYLGKPDLPWLVRLFENTNGVGDNPAGFYSTGDIQVENFEESNLFEYSNAWDVECMENYSMYFNGENKTFQWKTGKGYLVLINQINNPDKEGFLIHIEILNPNSWEYSTTFIPTLLKALLK